MPTNLYGPGDNYDLETPCVASLLRKFHEAKFLALTRLCCGFRAAAREFCLRSTDALVFLLKHHWSMNIMFALVQQAATGAAETRSCQGSKQNSFDPSKFDGTPRKLMDSSRLELGWNNVRSLEDGIASTYEHWLGSQT